MLKQYVIAIGGPLGSMRPLQVFFDHTPLNNASYIILQHLPEEYRSVPDEMLRRHSKLRVLEASEGASIENDKVYFAPPFYNLTISDDLVLVQDPDSREFADLPRKIIAAGNADYVLLPQDMPAIIQGYINRPLLTAGTI